MTHSCTNICLQRQYVKCYSRFCLKHKGVIPVPRHWDPEKLIVNKRTIQHFRSKAGSQCQALG
ncbi:MULTISPECIES: WPE palindromic element domain-containing protein [unclassified Wolbachia]|uniref:WPE palindromic element domain-containing protein n=1 Tax=unclassified Wolbachia TaxID=2640676 RepID=UPI0022315C3B|nr:WPE palindromic element domain-containing protein [Wolbachia endosymbiont (group A) of Apoderus coryli]